MQIFSLNLEKFLIVFIFISNINDLFARTPADSWLVFARTANKMFDKCLHDSESMGTLWSCSKRNTVILFDEISSADVIPLMDGVQLIRDPKSENSIWSSEDRPNGINNNMLTQMYGNKSINRTMWLDDILKRATDILSTHKIRFDLMEIPTDIGEGRARHRNQVFPAMIFGMAVLGMITIPIGFHLMSIIGGKAFLFAVMALLISTMTSLKRLADHGSPIGVSPPIYQPPAYYERNDLK